MSKAAVLAKIRKCLALASSSNEHEAAAALAKARALMEEHGVTDADVELADVDQRSASRPSKASRPPQWEAQLVSLIADVFQCESYLDGANVMFVGVSARPTVASYAFAMVRRIITKQRGEYIARRLRRCKAGTKRARADHFCQGFVVGVERAVAALVPASTGCELARQWMETNLSLRPVKSRVPVATRSRLIGDDYFRGFRRGREVELSHRLDGGANVSPARISAQ